MEWRAQYISGCIFYVFLACNDFIVNTETAGAPDLYGKRDNWLDGYSAFFSNLAKYIFVHSHDETDYGITTTWFSKTMLDACLSLLI